MYTSLHLYNRVSPSFLSVRRSVGDAFIQKTMKINIFHHVNVIGGILSLPNASVRLYERQRRMEKIGGGVKEVLANEDGENGVGRNVVVTKEGRNIKHE